MISIFIIFSICWGRVCNDWTRVVEWRRLCETILSATIMGFRYHGSGVFLGSRMLATAHITGPIHRNGPPQYSTSGQSRL